MGRKKGKAPKRLRQAAGNTPSFLSDQHPVKAADASAARTTVIRKVVRPASPLKRHQGKPRAPKVLRHSEDDLAAWHEARRGAVPLKLKVTVKNPALPLRPRPSAGRGQGFDVFWEDQSWVRGELRGSQGLKRLRTFAGEPMPTLDLHGYRWDEAKPEIIRFFKRFRFFGRVCVIHGKGLHSEAQHGVLRDYLIAAFEDGSLSLYVDAFCTAPAAFGGSGALLVLLRGRL